MLYLFRRVRTASPRRSAPRARLSAERLEDRAVPAVFTIADGDVAGLVNAINASNANGEADTINLAAGGTYTLTAVDNTDLGPTGLPVVTLDGSDANGLTI